MDCHGAKRKGQLVFEFLIAVVIFFGIILYILNFLNVSFAGYRSDFYAQDRESKAVQIAEMLVLNKGSWVGGAPTVLGLAQEWPVLSSQKIGWLNAYCMSDSNYEALMNAMGVHPRNRVQILVMNGSATLANCTRGAIYGDAVGVKRYGLSETGYVLTVSVNVWEQARHEFTQ